MNTPEILLTRSEPYTDKTRMFYLYNRHGCLVDTFETAEEGIERANAIAQQWKPMGRHGQLLYVLVHRGTKSTVAYEVTS